MSTYCSLDEFVRRVNWLTQRFPDYQHRIPIKHYLKIYNAQHGHSKSEILAAVHKTQPEAKIIDPYEGGYHNFLLVTNPNQPEFIKYWDGLYETKNETTYCLLAGRPMWPFSDVPEKFPHCMNDSGEAPQIQQEIIRNMFPHEYHLFKMMRETEKLEDFTTTDGKRIIRRTTIQEPLTVA